MHEIGCAKMNYRCPQCGEAVAKTDKEDHEREAHTKVVCQYCQIEFSKREHEPHEGQCMMRPKPCKFCEQIVKFEDYDRHVGYCGSKTKKCQVCQHNVCLKDEDMHNFGGECTMFQEQDRVKREQEAKKKMAEEEAKKKIDEQKKRELEHKLKQREQTIKQNFDDDLDWAVEDNPRGPSSKSNQIKPNEVRAGISS